MNNDRFRYDYVDSTTLSPIGAAVLVPLCALVLFGSRRYAVLATLASACFISTAQRISFFGADFNSLRILILVGILRILLRSETKGVKWRPMDAYFAAYALVAFVAYVLLHKTIAAAIYRIGELYTYGGVYILFRCWIQDLDDVVEFAKSLAGIAIPVGVFFAFEWATTRNLFSVFGGVSEITRMREGRLRCQGAFPHPILAGCFWAGTMPLILSLWWQNSNACVRWLGVLGALASMVIIAGCSSSTPLLALAGALFAACFLPLRHSMRAVQAVAVIGLVVLHFAREKPVWSLVAKVNIVGGSTGWHRYFLMDQAINRIGEWWMIGIASTGHWGHQLFDITNQYILEGVRGGLLAMLLFIAVLACAFLNIGRAACARGTSRSRTILVWSVGCALFGHALAFIAVSYFGQVPVIFWSTVAATAALDSSHSTPQFGGLAAVRARSGTRARSQSRLRRMRGPRAIGSAQPAMS